MSSNNIINETYRKYFCDVLRISVYSDHDHLTSTEEFIFDINEKKYYCIPDTQALEVFYDFNNFNTFKICLNRALNMWKKLNASCINYDRILTIYFNDVIVFSYGDEEEEFTVEKRDQISELFDEE
jgi:hypothetical protein